MTENQPEANNTKIFDRVSDKSLKEESKEPEQAAVPDLITS